MSVVQWLSVNGTCILVKYLEEYQSNDGGTVGDPDLELRGEGSFVLLALPALILL